MPFMVEPEAADVWLKSSVEESSELTANSCLDAVAYHRVSTAVGNVRNDEPMLIEPAEVDWGELWSQQGNP